MIVTKQLHTLIRNLSAGCAMNTKVITAQDIAAEIASLVMAVMEVADRERQYKRFNFLSINGCYFCCIIRCSSILVGVV